jgi:predicted kinase
MLGRWSARVHLLCGLNGAGKTTLARELASHIPAARFTLDEWMLRLYGLRYDDREYVARLRGCQDLIWDTALQVLRLGRDVVLDWNQWSRARRAEWRDRAELAGYAVVVHYVDVPLKLAIERMQVRNTGHLDDAHTIDEAGVRHLASIFEPPTNAEGMKIVLHS